MIYNELTVPCGVVKWNLSDKKREAFVHPSTVFGKIKP